MRHRCLAAVASAILLFASCAIASPHSSPYVDGRVTTDPNDWKPDELRFEDPDNDCRYYASDADLVDLYATWDADSLYVGLTTVNGPSSYGNGYLLYIDTDAQNGITGATDMRQADFYARQITFSTIGVDIVMGGWNLPLIFDMRYCSNPEYTTPVSGYFCRSGWPSRHVEVRVSWDALYSLGPGQVPPHTTLRFIAAIVGGEGTGAYDALPTSSTGIESDPSTPWNALTDLDSYVEVPVDTDGDGMPDATSSPVAQASWGRIKHMFGE